MKTNRLWIPGLGILFCVLGYGAIAYGIERAESLKLLGAYSLAFVGYGLLVQHTTHWKRVLFLGLGLRLLFLTASPTLSPDFFRFLWDGHLQMSGGNPYLFSPQAYFTPDLFPLAEKLYHGMGALHQTYPSIYPPASQLVYRLVAALAGDELATNILWLRGLQWALEVGVFFAGIALLKTLRLPLKNMGWYYLNPLVIIELSGNLHAEAILLFFWAWGLVALLRKNALGAGLWLGSAVAAKLLPLVLLPLIVRYLNPKKILVFGVSFLLTLVLWWFPFWHAELVSNYLQTLSLWFNTFEFNASVYYLYRWLGYQWAGYNIIASWGLWVPPLLILGIVGYSLFRPVQTAKIFVERLLWILTVYFLVSTTVHPWYLLSVAFIGMLTPCRFWLLWTYTCFWSYTAYGETTVQENLWLVGLGYALVLGMILYEQRAKNNLLTGH